MWPTMDPPLITTLDNVRQNPVRSCLDSATTDAVMINT